MRYVTINRTDRVGVNIYMRLILINNCEKNKEELTYVHTPLFNETFEEMFNLGASYKNIKNIGNKISISSGGIDCDSLKDFNEPKNLPDFSENFRLKMIKKLNKKYFNKQRSKNLNFCIHLRRGDTTRGTQLKASKYLRFTDDSFLQRSLDTIKSRFNNCKTPPLINIHSDSEIDMEKFKTYNLNVNTKFHVKPEEAISDMISCDCLFRYGISSFSGVAAFYNQNYVISEQPKAYEGMYKMDNVFKMKDFKKINFT